jgi:hypothetical protein
MDIAQGLQLLFQLPGEFDFPFLPGPVFYSAAYTIKETIRKDKKKRPGLAARPRALWRGRPAPYLGLI